MEELLGIAAGWWAYAIRWQVLLQITVIAAPPLALLILRKARPQARWLRHHVALSAALIILGIAAIKIAGAPTGLAVFFGIIYGLWLLIDWLRLCVEPKVNSSLLAKVDSEILRPLLLIAATFILVSKVSNLNQLAVIPLFFWLGSNLTVGQIVTVALSLYLLIVGSLPVSILLSHCLGRLLSLRGVNRRAMALIIRYMIVGAGIVWALDFTGFNRTAILAIAGGLSVGLGFGIKEVFSNFISGIWLLLEGSVRPGEVLFLDDEACEVRKLGLRAALLWRERDNTELLVPNQVFLATTTTTFTGSDGMRRCEVRVSAAYKHQPVDVMALLVQASSEVPDVLAHPAPAALVLDYGDSAIQYAIRFWIADPMRGTAMSSEVRLAIWRFFQAHGIEIPYPQLVLHRN